MAIRSLSGRRAQKTAAAVDDALLQGLRAGDSVAFEQLYADFAGSIYNVCVRILRSPQDAEDVTHEVFIKAFKRLPGSADDLRLRPWLNRVAINACYDHLRARRSHADLDATADSHRSPRLDSFEQAELGHVLEETLGSLSLDHRTVLLLKDVQGLTQKEIAGVLGVSNSATEARLFRAREAFRRVYAELTSPWLRGRCDFARQTAVESVGRGLSEHQRRRVLRHAETCPDCGEAVKGWGAAAVGLAALLPQVPLPVGLLAPPVTALGAGVAGAGAAAGAGVSGSGLAAAGAVGTGVAGAGASGTAAGGGLALAGALAAKVAVVVIASGALAGTAGLVAHDASAPPASRGDAPPVVSRVAAEGADALLPVSEGGAGEGRRLSTVGGPRGHRATTAAPGARRHGGKSPAKSPGNATGKTSRGRDKAPSTRAKGAQGKAESAKASTTGAAGHLRGACPRGRQPGRRPPRRTARNLSEQTGAPLRRAGASCSPGTKGSEARTPWASTPKP